jgi:LPS sulfotransferase NodH
MKRVIVKALIILSAMRSGSNWVCSLTNSTNKFGISDEWLLQREIQFDDAVDCEDHYKAVIKKGSTDNRIFSIKIFPADLYSVYETLGYDFIERCLLEYDAFVVLLDRIDRLGQAISAVRALETDQWSLRNDENKQAAHIVDIAYDRERILENIAIISDNMAFWRRYLAVKCIPFFPVFYEDIMSCPSEYLIRISKAMGISIDPDQVSTDLRIQRDMMSLEWRDRFHRESKLPISGNSRLNSKNVIPRNFRNFKKFLLGEEIILNNTKNYNSWL